MVSLLAALLAAASPLLQGEPAEVRTVTVTVTDEKGSPIQGLALNEVAVTENGAAREIRSLDLDSRPLTVALIVDSSAPVSSIFQLQMAEALSQFVARLPQGTRYALWTTGDRPRKVVDYTDDPAAASKALKRVYPQGGNTLLDALVEASKDLKGQEGTRSAIVVVTGSGLGFANWDRRQVVETLEKQRVPVFAVQIDEGRAGLDERDRDGSEVGWVDYDYVLGSVAKSSGGTRETLLSAMSLSSALLKVGAELRGQYRLSYGTLPGLKSRKLEVTVARPGVKVRVGPPLP